MATVVILPGGFHPYHAGHYALYQSARRTFPDADVYVAATDDRSQRPFPFAIKEKLAQLAGVEPGHFVQVRSPFQAQEITKNYDPEQDVVIFVRSEKDADQPPRAGGVKKDGTPAYLQPLLGAKKLETFNKHAYMAYLPTVEFGPGITSASEIRAAWPGLDERKKTAMVMSLYPRTQGNPKLAATVRKMLDTAIVSEEVMSPIAEGLGDYITKKIDDFLDAPKISPQRISSLMRQAPQKLPDDAAEKLVAKFMETERAKRLAQQAAEANQTTAEKIASYLTFFARVFVDRWNRIPQRDKDNALKNLVYNIGRFFVFILETLLKGATKREGVEENTVGYIQEKQAKSQIEKDPELLQAKRYAQHHYGKFEADPEVAFDKWVQRGLLHSQETDAKHDKLINFLTDKVIRLQRELEQSQHTEPTNEDYIDEKWSEKYKRSIDCSHPRGFSQRAHCAGRKK